MLRSIISKLLIIGLLTVNLSGCILLDTALEKAGFEQGDATTEVGENVYPDIVAIVAGKHANSCDISPEAVAEYLMRAAERKGKVFILTSEGNPQIIYDGDALVGDTIDPSWSDSKKMKHYKSAAKKLMKEYEEAMASSSGNDIRKAIALAGELLSAAEFEGKSKLLIVCDTGIGTEAPLDFRGNILSAEPEKVIRNLEEAYAIPKLEQTRVIWFGIGAVADPQPELNTVDQEKLKKLWEMLLLCGGADQVTFAGVFTKAMDCKGELPEVPVVEFEEETQIIYEASWSKDKENGITLPEESLYFNPDKASFRDKEAAIETLKPIAKELSEHAECKILLAGCTASLPAKEQWCYELSGMRAEACKEILIELMTSEYGVTMKLADEQIATVGLAYHDPWHVDDLDAAGHQTEAAKKNRRIVVLDYDTELARQLYAAGT